MLSRVLGNHSLRFLRLGRSSRWNCCQACAWSCIHQPFLGSSCRVAADSVATFPQVVIAILGVDTQPDRGSTRLWGSQIKLFVASRSWKIAYSQRACMSWVRHPPRSACSNSLEPILMAPCQRRQSKQWQKILQNSVL